MPLTQVGAAGETEQLVREDQVENEIKLFTLVLHSCLVLIHVILVVETLIYSVHYVPLWRRGVWGYTGNALSYFWLKMCFVKRPIVHRSLAVIKGKKK